MIYKYVATCILNDLVEFHKIYFMILRRNQTLNKNT